VEKNGSGKVKEVSEETRIHWMEVDKPGRGVGKGGEKP